MEIEVAHEKLKTTCDVCFKKGAEISTVGDYGIIFRVLLVNSTIKVTDVFLGLMKACKECITSLKNISECRDVLIENLSSDTTDEIDMWPKKHCNGKIASCHICLNTATKLFSLSGFECIINIMLMDREIDVPKQDLRNKKCCDRCKNLLKSISKFREFVVEKQINEETDSDNDEEKLEILSPTASNSGNDDISEHTQDLDEPDFHFGERASDIKSITKKTFTSGSFFCDQCDKPFKSRESLRFHLDTALAHAVKKFPCHLCDKKFLRQYLLDYHVSFVHEGNGGFLCPECGKRYCTPKALRAHKISHTNPDYFKKYKKKYDTLCHVCEECGKVFKNTFRYKKHIKYMHSTIGKDAYCEQCDKCFRNSESLKSHLANTVIHAQKRFECASCGKKFMTKLLLVAHIQYIHELKGHACPICKKVCAPPYGLTRHIQRIHNSSEDSRKIGTKSKLINA